MKFDGQFKNPLFMVFLYNLKDNKNCIIRYACHTELNTNNSIERDSVQNKLGYRMYSTISKVLHFSNM